ncbi:uncharacterized protein FFUJ_01997 [Fusarium fujikuroi IMI 58289]|uniref:Uncharacterized protein n=1 Tax=Gibberella fujikuroi (strain CBS 195.34 / IMI 58289 / NRRL A-6831) TaxID=1279085 RepID=S0DHG6_GIBF5|nr:uncharacterized protein FFUJ_01997 [Fusarium fujikuroi IMI 58289]KLP22402.1 uncharacterized protein LW94_1867 [Fusarium fujikuroi]CCT61524.1 uncharacterized protein FFUJ_01997 [Fusarium fujikuroi IMI 58289]SCO12849.1 uncharacterized protein FFM5_10426 [Fusarium fujikuroi]
MARKNNRKSKRRTRSKPTERFLWSNTERLQLRAYLDWCVQSCVKFEVTAPGYLQNVTGRQFSKERIRRKLYTEWQTYGKCNKFNDLFEQGTAGLLPLEGEEQETFYQIVASMSPAQGARCTRSRSLGLAARSGTLSAPRSIYSISSSREPNEVSTPQAGNSNAIPERPRQKNKIKSSSGPTRMSLNNDLSEDELTKNDGEDTVKSEDESELSTLPSPVLDAIGRQLANTIPDSQDDTMTIISQAQSNSSSEIRLRQCEADLLQQKSRSVTLEERISELKRINDDLEHCIRLASSAEGKNVKEAQLRKEISSLKDKLHRKRLLEENHNDLGADRLGFLNTSLHAEYEILHANIRDISSDVCHLSLLDNLPEQRTEFSPLANNWAQRIGGRDDKLGSLLSHCEAARIPKKVVLASLIAAGIFELVLEDVFPAFLAADSPLLDQYRRHIETESGWKALQRLDIISIKSLFSDSSIKDSIVSEKAMWLSSLVLQALSCFLPPESRDMTQRLTPSNPEKAAIKGMEAILTHALEVKIELLLCVKRMKYSFFKPGTLFDGKKMQVVESQAGDSALPGQKVQICLFPALFAVPETTDETEVEEETSLSATYSKALTEVSDKETESLVLLEKAIVFL